MNLKTDQWRGIHCLPWQMIPMSDCSHAKKKFLLESIGIYPSRTMNMSVSLVNSLAEALSMELMKFSAG